MGNALSIIRSKLAKGEPITLDFIGDSITWGLNHCSPKETYVARFAALFSKKYRGYRVVRYDGVVVRENAPLDHFDGPIPVAGKVGRPECAVVRNGVGGDTVRRAIKRKEDFLGILPNGRSTDVKFLQFGINDALSCDPLKYVSPERFEADYEELLSYVTSDDNCLVILVTPTYNGAKYPLDDYADVVKRVAARHDLPLIDAHRLWTEHYDEKKRRFGQGAWLSRSKTDACHFSPKGAKATARFLFDRFCEMMNY